MFYVQIVNNDNLGRLFGPATWDEAIAKVKEFVALEGPDEDPEVADKWIDDEGMYKWESGEGIYIVQAEDIATPFNDEPDEEDMEIVVGDSDDEFMVELKNGGAMEFDPADGSIRYIDSDGNCEGKWEIGDDDYDEYKSLYFPDAEIATDEDDEAEEQRRDEKRGLYGGLEDSAN